jgi:phage terminase small subunit
LNAKITRFVAEYLIDLNATQAAVRAGYSERTAYAQGSRLLKDAEVSAAVAAGMQARAERTAITQDRVLEELAVVGFSSVWDYQIDEDGNVTLDAAARPESIRAVASIKRKRRTIPRDDGDDIVEVETEIRLWDKPGVLRLAGQHLGMFTEKREVTLSNGGGVLMVPAPVSPTAWAEAVAARQAQLAATPALAPLPDDES